METVTILILLLIVAAAVAIAVQRLAVPYTVALVFTGLVLGLLHAFEAPHLTKALLFNVFLPGLLFEAAFHIEFKQFWRNRLTINSLALPGVVAAKGTPKMCGYHLGRGELEEIVRREYIQQELNPAIQLLLTAKVTISDSRKREFNGLYHPPQQLKVGQVGFDTSWSLSVRILYTTIICDDFGLLDPLNLDVSPNRKICDISVMRY